MLASMVQDGAGRRELLAKDSLVYVGTNICGQVYKAPACNALLLELFSLLPLPPCLPRCLHGSP